ncbi:MAG: hypothetical protein LCH93_17795 [Proteobacteria bacterium]|nr:hypothetical protein [Pseudomonadota bacterium]
MVRILAEAGDAHFHVAIREAPPLTLHGRSCWRTDGNSPVRIVHDRATVFFSRYQPHGHTLRRCGPRDLAFTDQPVPVRLVNDSDPRVGKWIEAIWQPPSGPLRGWYHAEEPAACTEAQLHVPFIGEAESDDDGLTWRCVRELLRLPADQADCGWRNGFFAGGYGDLSVVPDRSGRTLYLFFSSYHPAEDAQGVAALRLPADTSSATPSWWTASGWRTVGELRPKPIWPAVRGFRHRDPDCFWGPAVHYNHALKAYVMLLNRTAGGDGDLLQEGIYASMNDAIDDPGKWTTPLRIVQGGAWYPQAVGLGEGCGDTEVATAARFFMAGFSGWEIEFASPAASGTTNRPLTCTKQDFAEMFGADRRCPW